MWMSSWRRKTKQARPICPAIKAPCLEHGCAWWPRLTGRDPQSEDVLDTWGCAVLWHNTLLTENSGLLNQAVQSIQSMRNETATGLEAVAEALPGGRRKRGS